MSQANFPAHNLNVHLRWRWLDWIRSISLNLLYFNFQSKSRTVICRLRNLVKYPIHFFSDLCSSIIPWKRFKKELFSLIYFPFILKKKKYPKCMIMIINDYFTAWSPQKRDFSSFLKNENELLPAILMLSNKVIFLFFVPSPKIELCLFFLYFSSLKSYFSFQLLECIV